MFKGKLLTISRQSFLSLVEHGSFCKKTGSRRSWCWAWARWCRRWWCSGRRAWSATSTFRRWRRTRSNASGRCRSSTPATWCSAWAAPKSSAYPWWPSCAASPSSWPWLPKSGSSPSDHPGRTTSIRPNPRDTWYWLGCLWSTTNSSRKQSTMDRKTWFKFIEKYYSVLTKRSMLAAPGRCVCRCTPWSAALWWRPAATWRSTWPATHSSCSTTPSRRPTASTWRRSSTPASSATTACSSTTRSSPCPSPSSSPPWPATSERYPPPPFFVHYLH